MNNTFLKRTFTAPERSYFLFGPRGTGKSTLVNMIYPNATWIDLLDPSVYRSYLAHPERLQEVVEAGGDKQIVVIDEIQKVPQLLTVIHSLIEKKKGLQFILTGSSARKFKRAGVDLMAGRALNKTLHPFIAYEMGNDFSLTKALSIGMLPLVVSSPDHSQEIIQSYVTLYLQEEVYAEGLVRGIDSFARFLESVSFSHGSVLNLANISRECGVKRKTVENYISILDDLMLCFKIPVFTKKAKRELSSHPKFYIFDSGVFFSLRPKGLLDQPQEIQGACLEGLVAQHLRAWIDYSTTDATLSFWRTRSGLEVDFILYGSEDLWAIEVKNNQHIHPQDIRGLKAFKEDYPEAKILLLYRGREIIRKKGVLCLPCDLFLKKLIPNQKIWEEMA